MREYFKNVWKYLHGHELALLKKVSTPLLTNYSPEFDGSPELDERKAAFYYSLIVIMEMDGRNWTLGNLYGVLRYVILCCNAKIWSSSTTDALVRVPQGSSQCPNSV